MPITMTDIARKCGVSQPAVSAVLNNNFTNCRVSEVKRKKILKIAEQLHFTPNALAQSMVTRKTHIINVVIPSARFFQSYNYSTIITGLQDTASRHGYRLKFTSLPYGYSDFKSLLGVIADGNIVFYWGGPRHDQLVKEVHKLGLPLVVAYGKCGLPKTTNLYLDTNTAIQTMAQHLINRGHKQIAYINAFGGDILHQEGWQGICRAVENNPGVAVKDYSLDVPRDIEERPDELFSLGKQAFQKALAARQRPTAVMFNQDAIALGALQQAQAMGRQVPAEVAITGSGLEPYTGMFSPLLTTIDFQPYEYGVALGKMLFHRIGRGPVKPVKEKFPLKVLYRGTG